MQANRQPLVLINSGAYAHQELAAQFGTLPPAFLPVGMGRLYELQVRSLEAVGGDICLSLPRSFEIPKPDAERLTELGVTVIRTSDDLPLGAGVLAALAAAGFDHRPLRILHGDTLIEGVDFTKDDLFAVSEGDDGYRWAHVSVDDDGFVKSVPSEGAELRLCGYYAFGSAAVFCERLVMAGGDFVDALRGFAGDRPVVGAKPGAWLDFGHVQTFFLSRRTVTTARHFNSLEISSTSVRKRSPSTEEKIRCEARWLRAAPPPLQPFCARVLAEGEDSKGYFYETEYEYLPTLAELLVFGRLNSASWTRILGSCEKFLRLSSENSAETGEERLRSLVIDKTETRLEAYARTSGFSLTQPNRLNGRAAPSLNECLEGIARRLQGCKDVPSVMHGDFCFSNILYDFRTDRIRVIDPRGQNSQGAFSLFGDLQYDAAKLMHSIWGCYDIIIAGQHACRRTAPHDFEFVLPEDGVRHRLESSAKELTIAGAQLGGDVILAATTSLFLSMLPLHSDRPDRQEAFIANALRLYMALEGVEQ